MDSFITYTLCTYSRINCRDKDCPHSDYYGIIIVCALLYFFDLKEKEIGNKKNKQTKAQATHWVIGSVYFLWIGGEGKDLL